MTFTIRRVKGGRSHVISAEIISLQILLNPKSKLRNVIMIRKMFCIIFMQAVKNLNWTENLNAVHVPNTR